MDHTSKGWNCFNLYMHDGCVAGYVCDTVAGQCVLGAAGQGDSLTNCEESCSKDVQTDTYECDAETFTCVQATNKFDQKTCDASCADETPAALIGLWRGMNVQTGFMMGEYVMNFTTSTVAWGLVGDPRMMVAKVAIVSPSTLSLTVLQPLSSAGDVIIATYTNPGWPTGPQTTGMTVAIQADGAHQAPPQDARYAMGDTDFDVLSMVKCNSFGSSGCDFTKSFALSAEAVKPVFEGRAPDSARSLLAAFADLKTTDSCTAYGDCTTCLDDPSGVCGWCDGVVTDVSGSVVCGADGNGCCGGSDGFSYCNVAFRKTCPVICDYTDWINPSCRAATSKEINAGTQTFEDCDAMPWCTSTVYQYCDETALQCKTVYTEADCNAAPDCDVANPICDSATCKTISYIYCDEVLGCQSTTDKEECDANPACDSSDESSTCDPTKCVAQLFYTCDEKDFKCTPHTGPLPPTPYYNTTTDCTEACVSVDLTGVWRALAIDTGYVADEWDFAFTATTVKFVSRATGDSYSGTYVIGDAITSSSYPAAILTVTLSTGNVLKGVVSNDRTASTAKGPVTKFLYVALPKTTGTVGSFEAGMAAQNQEFVLMACLGDGIEQGCDFSSASP